MSSLNGHYTKIEQCILSVLSDGRPHRREELHSCLYDDMGALTNIHPHLSAIRRKLPPGQEIICRYLRGRLQYQHILTLSTDDT